MKNSSTSINVIWFKRDLRLEDHEPLHLAQLSRNLTLLIYCFEPELVNSDSYDVRHWRFVWQSLTELNQQLIRYDHRIHIVWSDFLTLLGWIKERYSFSYLLSHQETGLKITYERDLCVANWCKAQGISWLESQSNGVIRGLTNRSKWREQWSEFVNKPLIRIDLTRLCTFYDVELERAFSLPEWFKNRLVSKEHTFQPGGSRAGAAYLSTFLNERSKNYRRHMSKPEASRLSCSRLSPYLAWGCLSIRQVYQAARNHFEQIPHAARIAEAFLSRLRWQAHFIQKFESECEIEFRNFNRGFDELRTEWNEVFYQAWAEGRTGYPLVDACMRCLQATGWINFRMRAMLVSFLTHHLWLDWQSGAKHLSRLFLDFEPGIHYPQFHMQAGTTGVHTFRIYNPERQAYLHDPGARFIQQWLPELRSLPPSLALVPYRMTYMEQVCYGVRLGLDYPNPIVDIQLTYRNARERLWQFQLNNPLVKLEAQRIIKRHTTPDRIV